MPSTHTEDFEVIISSSSGEDDTKIITISEKNKRLLSEALDKFDSTNRQYSTYLSDGKESMSDEMSPKLLEDLADSPQSNLASIVKINQIVRRQINKNDLIGITASSIENNINTDYNLSYKDFSSQRNKQKSVEKSKALIEDLNAQIRLRNLIRNSIPLTYDEGNYCMYLRKSGNKFTVDYYPLGVAIISDYEVDGNPVLLIDIKKLTSKLQKTRIKTKKGKALFFNSLDDEIKANYPEEVYRAYVNKEIYAKLDHRYSGVIRIGNLNRKYGVTPFFRALPPTLMLDTFENADRINTKAKAKKIIVQLLNDKLLGEKGDNEAFEQMAYAHDNFMSAWKMPTVVVTPPAYVKQIVYVEPKTELTNVDIVNQYRNRVMTCLGIGFLSQEGKQTVSTANISVDQLMLTINKIAEQLEEILNRWYQNILEDSGIGREFAPVINVLDSEQMSFDVKKSLAEFLYSKLGASYKTSFSILGVDVEDEKQRREKENAESYDEIFTPHPTSYTLSDGADESNPDNSLGGRPKAKKSKNQDKQQYDQTRTEANK